MAFAVLEVSNLFCLVTQLELLTRHWGASVLVSFHMPPPPARPLLDRASPHAPCLSLGAEPPAGSHSGTHVPPPPVPSPLSSCLHFCPPVGSKVMASLSHSLLAGKMLEKTARGVFFEAQRQGAAVEPKCSLHFLLLGSKSFSPQGTVRWRGSPVCWRRLLLLCGFRSGVVLGF